MGRRELWVSMLAFWEQHPEEPKAEEMIAKLTTWLALPGEGESYEN